jgi:hypothetical protein
MVTDLGKDGANLFGLRYGGKLRNCSITNLIDIAGVQDVSDQDILKMKRIHELLLGNDYGIYFYNNQHDIKSKSQQYVDMSTHDLSIIRAMRTKPFILLAGISGTGKSRIVKEFAYDSCPDIPNLRKDPTSPGNYCLIEVKPNWHDSTELLGYESKIGGAHYNITTFIKFLVKAMRYTNVPFFVCLDEMNLAPVEQYFAEFLSILESRKLVNGIITSEPLIPASIFNSYNLRSKLFDYTQIDSSNYCHSEISEDNAGYGIENEIYKRLQEDGLRIPSNLIVIGTVNMDETTHQFSRKVIDRAMTIEMNIGDGVEPFKKFFDEYKDLGYIDTCLSKDVFLPSIVSANEALNLLNEEDAEFIKSHIPNLLSGLNEALSGTPFKVAYRVQNELVIYFTVLRQDFPDETAENLLSMAVDDILMMKVLPRIEGDDQLLEQPLIRLSNFTSNYPKSMSKIDEMMKRLSASQFTSFWP